ncbi:toll/interleukin-1 receptor domain-containing protein [Saccharothrix sp. 6-C]|uniref:toll/interleukin-1 receptor domain-containing protein n=1 Tax=Saccharothrix sp. 6-C TaxID=2781735 RepID=UPI001916CE22|nr:toll/interleukin-1 receptor domain-containing protein [Saccharothrix sp. 6-C]QQQ80218.1 toll/interleukin-1 receptor domain-containing protein [Saccharothrix sp. 6-C]
MTKVFLNYRVTDQPFGAALLDRALSERFGSDAVFLASKSIPPGADWEVRMFEAVEQCAALLVVMGTNWLGETRPDGSRRLDDHDDFVRRELLTAAALDKVVVPVRLDSPRVARDDFPVDLAWLADLQDVEVSFRTARADIDNLANRLAAEVGLPAPQPRSTDTNAFTVSGNRNHVWQAGRVDVAGDFHAGPSYGRGRRTS